MDTFLFGGGIYRLFGTKIDPGSVSKNNNSIIKNVKKWLVYAHYHNLLLIKTSFEY